MGTGFNSTRKAEDKRGQMFRWGTEEQAIWEGKDAFQQFSGQGGLLSPAPEEIRAKL